MAYLYRHIRLDKNVPFYIGIGSDNKGYYQRAVAKNSKVRNKFWINIINKTPYKVEIMLDDLTWEEACEKEKEFIKLYGRRNIGKGTLVNLTDGGDGTVGLKMDESAKLKISKALTGLKRSDAYKVAKSNLLKGKVLSKETKSKMSQSSVTRWKTATKLPKSCKTVLDLETGVCFDSVAICYRSLNISRNSMIKRLKNKRRFVYVD